jgi:hypothetical protein
MHIKKYNYKIMDKKHPAEDFLGQDLFRMCYSSKITSKPSEDKPLVEHEIVDPIGFDDIDIGSFVNDHTVPTIGNFDEFANPLD